MKGGAGVEKAFLSDKGGDFQEDSHQEGFH